jgi:hypothetical protein
MAVLADPPRGAARADPRALRLAVDGGAISVVDALPQLTAAAEAARRAGGLPAGAALVVAGLAPIDPPVAGTTIAVRIVGGGTARAALA